MIFRIVPARWYLVGLLALALVVPVVWLSRDNSSSSGALAADRRETAGQADQPSSESGSATSLRVEAIKPKKGGIDRPATQPGTVIAFESAKLYAKFAGFLKTQNVDIGSRVKRDQVLAEIDSPELLKEVDREAAAVEQAKAQVLQAEARIATAKADELAAQAAIKQSEADVDKTKAYSAFREKQYNRYFELFKLKSIDERLVDEKMDEMEAARAAERLALAGVANAKAQAAAATARVAQAHADLADARAKVDLANASLEKSKVLASYLQIVSPYDGVITARNFFRGDFIRSADQSQMPLLVVDRTDKMRVVVQVADSDVPFTHVGDEAVIRIPALPGMEFVGKVSRMADAEDNQTRTMRVEIDLPNPKGLLRQGMYGRTSIRLGALPNVVRIPSSCVVGDVSEGEGKVYVVRNGVARLIAVQFGRDDGLNVDVVNGLTASDEVVDHPSTTLYDGARVTIIREPAAAGNSTARASGP